MSNGMRLERKTAHLGPMLTPICNLPFLPLQAETRSGSWQGHTSQPGTDRTISFELKNGVAIYGGFAGTETLRTQRNPATNVTVLSGDIGSQVLVTAVTIRIM